MSIQAHNGANHSIQSATLADVLERVLDKGLVIAGDIKIKLVDIELLTIQIRLVVASVEKAREMGMDWWTTNADFRSRIGDSNSEKELADLRERLARLEAAHPGPPEPRP
jgi:Gas vesicle protein